MNTNGMPAKHGRGLTARTRAAILKALDIVDSRGTTVAEVLADAFIAQPLRFMDTTAKYIIKDINTDMDSQKDLDSLTNQELAEIVATHARKQREQLELEHSETQPELTTVGQNMANK